MVKEEIYNIDEIKLLSHCTICPRECGVNRFEGGTGYCGSDAGMNIASICVHRGEEPPISGPEGICNIFFAGCNLRCVYCQNHEISRPGGNYAGRITSLNKALDTIGKFLSAGVRAVGFVSPSHVVPQVRAIIHGLNLRGLKPVTVYNTNSYDKPEVIESLDGLIDVWLPDYKYVSPSLAEDYSDAPLYPEVALRALKKMYWLKGSVLHTGSDGIAESGMLIRHLVLPGQAGESRKILKSIAEEFSAAVHISLMSQYHPTPFVNNHPDLRRILYKTEYDSVVETMEDLGFSNGWVQGMDSFENYRPDFGRDNPFE